ncbi:MAG: NAD-dependent epimerase/dehydratase family protein [Erysipelotrichaceae bacterium]
MRKILVTGKNSYIGTSFKQWMAKTCLVDEINLQTDEWKDADFSHYDVVFHVAGIAHVSTDPKYRDLYFKVNRDLAIEVANKSKESGVSQFIFMSSAIVYGKALENHGKISMDSIPKPDNFYGESKLQAEASILELSDAFFRVVILRPPMIYGYGSKGNYPKLSTIAKKLPFFIEIDNQRSMLHIDNLCSFLQVAIERDLQGTFFPQNDQYVSTSRMVRTIAEVNGKEMPMIKIPCFFEKLLLRIPLAQKAFGNLYYDKEMSLFDQLNYIVTDFKTSIRLSEISHNVEK